MALVFHDSAVWRNSLRVYQVRAVAPARQVVAGLGGERYLARVERVPLDPCGPECTENASTYVLRELARLRPAQDIAAAPVLPVP